MLREILEILSGWSELDTWIVVTAALAAMACALPGNFLLVRRQSMMGIGVFSAVLTEWVQRLGRVESAASLGVVFTTLFALGRLLIRTAADPLSRPSSSPSSS
jgi:manganese/zinc/iron transport system permease protein